jgi:hypothetical protein
MVGLISTIVRRPGSVTASANPNLVDQLQRLEQAAGFSMVAFDPDDDLSGQTVDASRAEANETSGIAHRMAAMIDECTTAVTSYLRPAI